MEVKEQDNPNKRIAKNTLYLYFRSILVMAISVYTSRIILQTLGVEDFGIYNVVGGFVGMFSILSSSLVNASQRFISFEMGKSCPQLKKVFNGTLSIHIILALVLFVLFESFGVYFLYTKLNISDYRINAAFWVFQCSVLTFCVNLISIPYNASIVAHEKMKAFAYISLIDVVAKLVMVYMLKIVTVDKLIVYAFMMMAIAVILRFIYGWYCSKNFSECKFKFSIDKILFKDMLSFSGWNFIGSTATILVTQGINVLTNIFFGVWLNAARGIAEQVNTAINSFIANFMTAMNPQITKSYASGDYDYMNNLMVSGAKYATILFWFLSLPVFVETEYILEMWLVDVPPYAPVFVRLSIIYSIFQSLSNSLYIGMLATGKIKKYQISMGSLYISSFFLCYFLFKLGVGPEWGYISTIFALFIGMFVRLYLLRQMIPNFSVSVFVKDAILKSISVIVLSSIIVYCVSILNYSYCILKLICVIMTSFTIIPFFSYFVALNNNEKVVIIKQIRKCIKK